MVYFEDLGAVIDAAGPELSDFLDSELHGGFHTGARNFEVKERAGSTVVIAFERLIEGTWSRAACRVTDFAPFCVCVEEIEGELAGTKLVLIRRPKGDRTQVDVYGDIRSKTFDEKAALKFFLDDLESTHREDVNALSIYRQSKTRVPPR